MSIEVGVWIQLSTKLWKTRRAQFIEIGAKRTSSSSSSDVNLLERLYIAA